MREAPDDDACRRQQLQETETDNHMRIIDTHAHYDDEAFDSDRDELLSRGLREGGVELVVNVGASMRGADQSRALSHTYGSVYAACGIHPDDVGVFEHAGTQPPVLPAQADTDAQEEGGCEPDAGGYHGVDPRFHTADAAMEHIRQLCLDERCVAVGEIGLDYHWMVEEKEVQKKWFDAQLSLAEELGLPVNIHSREASQDTFDIIRAHTKLREAGGIIHCYSGSAEMAREYVKMGYHIGIGGVVTFKNGKTLKRVVSELPLEMLVTETDSPYLAPTPHRGERNDSRNIRYVIGEIARLKEMDAEECAEILRKNAFTVYAKLGN